MNFSVSVLTFCKIPKCFPAALVFKFLVRQFHGMLQAIGKNCGTEFLRNEIQKIILESFGNPADHCYGDRSQQ